MITDDTHKNRYIADLIAGWADAESTLVWCLYNAEQDAVVDALGCASITGDTEYDERERIVAAFKAGTTRTLATKPKILGFGLNLQVATRQVFSGLQDSYESYYQAVKRSNRIGSTKPLNVHIPITELEAPMVQTVLRKAKQVQTDAAEQEAMFKSFASETP